MKKTEKIKTGIFYRSFAIDKRNIDEEKRTVALSFSSEEPCERYFGSEILSHKKGHVDLSFLNSGTAPLLREHWRDEQIGVIESAEIGKDNKGRALVRFGNSAAAKAEFEDVKDGIRSNVSVGYRIRHMVLEEDDEDKGRTYRVDDWVPMEVSIVSIPADQSVGVGRKAPDEFETEIELLTRAAEPAAPKKAEVIMTDEEKKALQEKQDREKKEAIDKARTDAVAEVREIIAIGESHGMSEKANEFINTGRSAQEFKDYVLAEMAKRGATPVNTPDLDQELGLTGKEVRQFSFMKAIRALAHPGNRSFIEDASFEFECSKAVEDKSKRTAKGLFVPTDVLRAPIDGKRDLEAQIGTAGGYLVDHVMGVGSFIETLENSMAVKELGAIILRDLVGDLSIPKQTGGATAYWIGEGEDITESQQTFGQVALRPMGVGAYTDITRKMMLQSSIDIENFVRNDLALRLALAIDLAALAGTGAAGQPLGILNTTGIGSVTLNAANAPDWGDIIDLETAVAIDNALNGKLAYTANATIQGNMKQTVKHATATTGFILEGKELNGYPFMMSNQVTAKYIIFGNWADLVLGFWSGVDINVDNSTLSKSGGTRVVAIQDVDVAVRHAESFASGYKA